MMDFQNNIASLFIKFHSMSGYLETLKYTLVAFFSLYFGMSAFFHFFYYKNKRNCPETWKCQPKKWISPKLELQGILLGSFTTLWSSPIWAALATYIKNGGEASQVYFNHAEAGYIWLFAQTPVVFILMDYVFYWQHRLYHLPWMYKHFHKVHHAYKQPTAFITVVFHPLEYLSEILVIMSPVFLVPLYWLNILVIYMYMFVHGFTSHSGVNLSKMWWQPWQPDTKYHDLHHQHTHGNYGFFLSFWDQLHGTALKLPKTKEEDSGSM